MVSFDSKKKVHPFEIIPGSEEVKVLNAGGLSSEGKGRSKTDNGFNNDTDGHDVVGGDMKSAVLGIIKGMVGPAILYLPHGLSTSGYMIAFPIMILSTIMFLFCVQCLFDSWKLESDRQHGRHEGNGDDETVVPQNGFVRNNSYDFDSDSSINDDGDLLQQQSETKRKNSQQAKAQSLHLHLQQQQSQGHSQSPKELSQAPKKLSYPELAYRALGVTGQQFLKIGIALMQSGVCLTYLIFVPQNLSKCYETMFHKYTSPIMWLWIMILLEIPLSWTRDIRKLACTNAFANVCILYGLCMCIFVAFTISIQPLEYEDEDSISNTIQTNTTITNSTHENTSMGEDTTRFLTENGSMHNILTRIHTNIKPFENQWYLFIGTSVLLFEGSITLLIPLQESIVSEEQKKNFSTVYKQVITSIVCFYAIFASINYVAYGNDVETALTTSLPSGYISISVQVLYSVAVILTFPLQNFPALEISIKWIQKKCDRYNADDSTFTKMQQSQSDSSYYNQLSSNSCNKNCLLQRNVISSFLVILLGFIATFTMDRLDKVVSLTGCLLGIPIAFIFPPIIHTRLLQKNGCFVSQKRYYSNYGVATLGAIIMVFASVITIITW